LHNKDRVNIGCDMSKPTIAARMQHKMIMMTDDVALCTAVQAALPEGWQMLATVDLDRFDNFSELLLYRFVFLDLDLLTDTFDPQDVLRKIRMEWMLNVPVFCMGGQPEERDEARLNRADRFFERDEVVQRVLQYCGQFGW